MNYSKKIVCLASSRKPGGRCVAGKELLPDGYGVWVRPVSARSSAEITFKEREFENGQEPAILDVVDIPMIGAVPRVHQTENQMIDSEYYWTKEGVLTWADVDALADEPPSLWGTGDSTYHGLHDRITQGVAAEFQNSPWLVKPEDVTIHVFAPGRDFGNPKRAVRASFRYQSRRYDFKVTDPSVEMVYLAGPDGDFAVTQDVYFCTSLAEAHTDGFCYKLVATIISERPLTR